MRSCDPVKGPGLPDQYWTTFKPILWVGFFFFPDAAPMETLVMGNYDLTGLRRGNSFRRTFRFKDGSGDPVDLGFVQVVGVGVERVAVDDHHRRGGVVEAGGADASALVGTTWMLNSVLDGTSASSVPAAPTTTSVSSM